VKGGRTLTRLTSDPSPDGHPILTADAQRIVFASLRSGAYNLYVQAADGTGTAERLTAGSNRQIPAVVLPDGGIIGTEIALQGDIVWFKRAASPPAEGTSAESSPWHVEPFSIARMLVSWLPGCGSSGSRLCWVLPFARRAQARSSGRRLRACSSHPPRSRGSGLRQLAPGRACGHVGLTRAYLVDGSDPFLPPRLEEQASYLRPSAGADRQASGSRDIERRLADPIQQLHRVIENRNRAAKRCVIPTAAS
jgi:hypothetical protein